MNLTKRATILISQNSVTKLWICRYCEINSNSFVNIDTSCQLFLHAIGTPLSYIELCNTTCYGILKMYSRDNIHRATYKIRTLCALFKPNCELAAVCKQSCTHCVLSPAISLHVPTHWEIKDFLHKDSSGNIVDFVFLLGSCSLYAQWLDSVCCPLSFMFLLYEM